MGDSTNPLSPIYPTRLLVMLHTHKSIALLLALLILGMICNALFPIALYISALFEPDITGYPDCDIMNDWLAHVLPVLREATYIIGIRICLHYPIP